jgi:dihydrofolate reductase
VVDGDPVDLVRRLKAEDGLGIYLAGGGNLAGQLRAEIDEWVIKLSPLLIGAGMPLMTHDFAPQRLTGSKPMPSGVVILRYRPGD